MTLVFKTASKEQQKLKITISGQSGSGKTMGAIRLARGMATCWENIYFIDTERSANKYADLGPFKVLEMPSPYSPDECRRYIRAAIEAGAEVIIFDSASTEWEGTGGCLEIMDDMKTSNRGDSFSGWAKVGKMHKRFIEDILRCPAHFITTIRVKTEWVIEKNEQGKNQPRKLGLKEVQREGWEYEFDIALNVARSHFAECDKDRTNTISDEVPFQITQELGLRLANWAKTGTLAPIEARDDDLGKAKVTPPPVAQPSNTETPKQPEAPKSPETPDSSEKEDGPTNAEIKDLVEVAKLKTWQPSDIKEVIGIAFGIKSSGQLTRVQYGTLRRIVTEHTPFETFSRFIEENRKRIEQEQAGAK